MDNCNTVANEPRRVYKCWLPILGLASLWLMMVLLAHPVGEFPLIDDYTYAEPVFHLLDSGKYVIASNTATCAITQIAVGCAVCKVLGSTYLALRAATLFFGLIGVVLTYAVLREAGAGSRFAWFGAALVAINPVYFALSCTFMTDVPFFALEAVAFYCFLRVLNGKGRVGATLVIATVFSVLATLTRQFGIGVALAFSIAYMASSRLRLKTLCTGLLPTVVTAVCLAGFEHWAKASNLLPPGHATLSDHLRHFLAQGIKHVAMFPVMRTSSLLSYLALFFLPLCFALFPLALRRRRWLLWSWLSVAGAATIVLSVTHHLMPAYSDTWRWNALGLFGLRDNVRLGEPWTGARLIWSPITFFCITAAGLMTLWAVQLFVRAWRSKWFRAVPTSTRTMLFCGLCLPLYMLPLIVWETRAERYFIPFMLPALVLMVPAFRLVSRALNKGEGRSYYTLGWAVAGLMLIFSVTATHDYFAWNNTRWTIINELVKKAQIEDVDGGYEFNGLHYFYYNHEGCWRYKDQGSPRYVVCFRPLSGYHVVDERPYSRWLLPGKAQLLVLERDVTAASAESAAPHHEIASKEQPVIDEAHRAH